MSNLAQVMKNEISRLARKEIRNEMKVMQAQISKLRKTVSSQKKVITGLEKEINRIIKKVGIKDKSDMPTEEEAGRARLNPASIERLRKKFSLSRNEMAALIDVNPNSIYLWEQGKATPRLSAKIKLVSLRSMGKKEINKLLETKMQNG